MPDFKQYDPGKVAVSFNGIQIQGIAPDTFVRVARTTDAYAKEVGAGGDVTRVRSRDRSGEVTITLMAASPTNDLLSAVHASDELLNDGVGELQVQDNLGTTILVAANAWIKKLPEVEFGSEGGTREWMFECAELEMLVGGSVTE